MKDKVADLNDSFPRVQSTPRGASRYRRSLKFILTLLLLGHILVILSFNYVVDQKEGLAGWSATVKACEYTIRATCDKLLPACPLAENHPKPAELPYRKQSRSVFDWDSVVPSPKLEYSQCYQDFYCARLEVPLDWAREGSENAPKAAIAVIKRPAIVDVTHPSYGGAVLLNPGGPGGSGVQFTLGAGEALQYIIDSRNEHDFNDGGDIIYHSNIRNAVHAADQNDTRYFDLISFDPRGVGSTTPHAVGITDPGRFRFFQQRLNDIGVSFQNEEVLSEVYDLIGLYGSLVSMPSEIGPHEELDSVAKYVTTASVVRDMIEIVERHGEWRENAAKKILENSKYTYPLEATVSSPEAVTSRTAWKEGKEKLQYWGFSYGTIIGQTFASMYPDRIDRMVLDGVVNVTDYYTGGWKTDLLDDETINANFTIECAAAGPSHCLFAQAQNSTQDHNKTLLDTFNTLLTSLKTSPITGLIDTKMIFVPQHFISGGLFSARYSGYFGYRASSTLLWEAFTQNTYFFRMVDNFFRTCPGSSSNSSQKLQDPRAGQVSILCADSGDKTQQTKAEYKEYIELLNEVSPTFGNVLAPIMMPCHAFTARPTYEYRGPWGAENTSAPILFASQTLDPITPLRSAEGAAALFPGSAILEAQGIGHTTLGYPNLCAAKEIQRYFRTGDVKSGERTVCAPELKPFDQMQQGLVAEMRKARTLSERAMLMALWEVGREWPMEFHLHGAAAGEKREMIRGLIREDMETAMEGMDWDREIWWDRSKEVIDCENAGVEGRERIRSQYVSGI